MGPRRRTRGLGWSGAGVVATMKSNKIGVIGSGDVGKVPAAGFKKHGCEVTIGSREGDKPGE